MEKQPDKMAPSQILSKTARQNGAVSHLSFYSTLSRPISENLTKRISSTVCWKFLLKRKLNKELAAK